MRRRMPKRKLRLRRNPRSDAADLNPAGRVARGRTRAHRASSGSCAKGPALAPLPYTRPIPPRPSIQIPRGWAEVANADGPLTLERAASSAGVIQISLALFTGGKEPRPTADDLIALARTSAAGLGVEITDTIGGACPLGLYGLARGRTPELACAQFWHLSNGRDFIFATYLAERLHETELHEAETLIFNLGITPPRPWWKLW